MTAVTHILSLDKNNVVGVHTLKRDLLKIIGVDDFSVEANFRSGSQFFFFFFFFFF